MTQTNRKIRKGRANKVMARQKEGHGKKVGQIGVAVKIGSVPLRVFVTEDMTGHA